MRFTTFTFGIFVIAAIGSFVAAVCYRQKFAKQKAFLEQSGVYLPADELNMFYIAKQTTQWNAILFAVNLPMAVLMLWLIKVWPPLETGLNLHWYTTVGMMDIIVFLVVKFAVSNDLRKKLRCYLSQPLPEGSDYPLEFQCLLARYKVSVYVSRTLFVIAGYAVISFSLKFIVLFIILKVLAKLDEQTKWDPLMDTGWIFFF